MLTSYARTLILCGFYSLAFTSAPPSSQGSDSAVRVMRLRLRVVVSVLEPYLKTRGASNVWVPYVVNCVTEAVGSMWARDVCITA